MFCINFWGFTGTSRNFSLLRLIVYTDGRCGDTDTVKMIQYFIRTSICDLKLLSQNTGAVCSQETATLKSINNTWGSENMDIFISS